MIWPSCLKWWRPSEVDRVWGSPSYNYTPSARHKRSHPSGMWLGLRAWRHHLGRQCYHLGRASGGSSCHGSKRSSQLVLHRDMTRYYWLDQLVSCDCADGGKMSTQWVAMLHHVRGKRRYGGWGQEKQYHLSFAGTLAGVGAPWCRTALFCQEERSWCWKSPLLLSLGNMALLCSSPCHPSVPLYFIKPCHILCDDVWVRVQALHGRG